VRGSPAKLSESQSFQPAIDVLLSEARLRAASDTAGFDLCKLPHALVAGYDLGTLYLAELPGATAGQARAQFLARQIRDPKQRQPDPNIAVIGGMNEGIPSGLVTLDDRVVAYGVGDPMLWRVVEAYGLRKLRAKRAFEGAALAGLETETADAPLAAYVPGPFGEQWQNAAAGLLAVATALSAKVVPTSPGNATLHVTLYGDFANSNAAERLRSTYMSVASSSTGTLLGLQNALEPRTMTSPQHDRVSLVVPLPITEIARATRSLTSGDLTDIFRISRAKQDVSAPTSSPESR
jgi:hypothetical protein